VKSIGIIENVVTHPEHRRTGLGRSSPYFARYCRHFLQ